MIISKLYILFDNALHRGTIDDESQKIVLVTKLDVILPEPNPAVHEVVASRNKNSNNNPN